MSERILFHEQIVNGPAIAVPDHPYPGLQAILAPPKPEPQPCVICETKTLRVGICGQYLCGFLCSKIYRGVKS